MIIDGIKIRDKILDELKEKISNENLNITLAIILVGNNISNDITCDGFIFVDTKYTIHNSIEANNILTIPNKYLDSTYSFLLTGRYDIK